MTDLKTEDALLNTLKSASKYKPTAEELHKQRVSFIMGSLSETSTVTRAQVAEQLAVQEGKRSLAK